MAVAQAAPATPIPRVKIKRASRMTFIRPEISMVPMASRALPSLLAALLLTME